MNDDFLLVDEGGKNNDIIDYGEVIAGNIGKFKCIQPGILAGQLQKLQLVFKDDVINNLNQVSKCLAIEGVEVSPEELDALKEAAMAKREAEDGAADALEEASNIPMDIGSGISRGKNQAPMNTAATSQPNLADLKKEMDKMNIGGGPTAAMG